MGPNVIFQYKNIMYNNQILKIIISVTSNMYYFFVLEMFKLLSSRYFEIQNKLLLIAVTLH
jgi:hypothetical protein